MVDVQKDAGKNINTRDATKALYRPAQENVDDLNKSPPSRPYAPRAKARPYNSRTVVNSLTDAANTSQPATQPWHGATRTT